MRLRAEIPSPPDGVDDLADPALHGCQFVPGLLEPRCLRRAEPVQLAIEILGEHLEEIRFDKAALEPLLVPWTAP